MFVEKLKKKDFSFELFKDKYKTLYDINIIEKKYKVIYPDDYKKFIEETNGLFLFGYPDISNFEGNQDGFGFGGFYGCFNENKNYDIQNQIFLRYNRYPKKYFPIAFNDNGDDFIMSLNKKDYGYVYFWDHEKEYGLFEGQDDEYGGLKYFDNMTLIAKSFTEFIEKIEPYKDIQEQEKKEKQEKKGFFKNLFSKD